MTEATPPVQPKANAHDRKVLRDRLTGFFKERRLSGRQVERSIGVATGTLSKVFAGKMQLTHRLLQDLATVLKVGAELIVEGTSFEALLRSAVVTPETEQVVKLKAELDSVRVEKQAVGAALAQCQDDLATVRKELSDTTEANLRLEGQRGELVAQLEGLRSDVSRLRQEATETEQKQRTALAQVTNERQQRAADAARISALAQQVEQWRVHALDREQRVQQLEAYVQHLQAQGNGAAVGSGLLGFALGALITSANRDA